MAESPFHSGCVVLNQSAGGVPGIVFKPSARTSLGCFYSSMFWAKLGEAGDVTIAFSHHTVKLTGKRLEPVVEWLSTQRATEIRVATRAEALSTEGTEPVIEKITIEEA